MPKLPWIKFYPADWFSEVGLQACSAATRGVWFDLLMRMHSDGQTGTLAGTISNFASWGRCTEDEAVFALAQLRDLKVATVTCNALQQKSNEIVTVTNRRMKKVYQERASTKERVNRHRHKNSSVTQMKLAGNAVDVRCQMSDVRKEEEKDTPANAAPKGAVRCAFKPPSLSEVEAYMMERQWRDAATQAQAWLDYYEANGWRVGRNPMKDWRAAVRTWERNGVKRTVGSGTVTNIDAVEKFRLCTQCRRHVDRCECETGRGQSVVTYQVPVGLSADMAEANAREQHERRVMRSR